MFNPKDNCKDCGATIGHTFTCGTGAEIICTGYAFPCRQTRDYDKPYCDDCQEAADNDENLLAERLESEAEYFDEDRDRENIYLASVRVRVR